jgi:heme oxygenase
MASDNRTADGLAVDEHRRGAANAAATQSLSARLKRATAAQHRRAERSGVVRALLDGLATRADYLCYQRNLHPVYAALEARLAALPRGDTHDALCDVALFRAAALRDDLADIAGADWPSQLPGLAVTQRYVADIENADHAGLVGHAYVRYLGDLNGGQVLQRLVQRRFDLAPGQLRFYRFDTIQDPGAFIIRYRAALDAAVPAAAHARVVAAAQAGFDHNIALSEAVMAASVSR